MARGFLRVAVVGSTEVRLHWLTPIVWFIGGVALSRGTIGFAGVGAAACVYAVHVLGHWAVARMHRLEVSTVDIDATGGSVVTRGRASRAAHARVAFGGVLAHALLGLVLVMVPGGSAFVQDLIWVNMILGAINILPLGRLDGAAGWRHVRRVLSEPMATPDFDNPHPAIRARALAADADRDIGHTSIRRPGSAVAPELEDVPELDWNTEDAVVRDIMGQFSELMDEVRADARNRNSVDASESSS